MQFILYVWVMEFPYKQWVDGSKGAAAAASGVRVGERNERYKKIYWGKCQAQEYAIFGIFSLFN